MPLDPGACSSLEPPEQMLLLYRGSSVQACRRTCDHTSGFGAQCLLLQPPARPQNRELAGSHKLACPSQETAATPIPTPKQEVGQQVGTICKNQSLPPSSPATPGALAQRPQLHSWHAAALALPLRGQKGDESERKRGREREELHCSRSGLRKEGITWWRLIGFELETSFIDDTQRKEVLNICINCPPRLSPASFMGPSQSQSSHLPLAWPLRGTPSSQCPPAEAQSQTSGTERGADAGKEEKNSCYHYATRTKEVAVAGPQAL